MVDLRWWLYVVCRVFGLVLRCSKGHDLVAPLKFMRGEAVVEQFQLICPVLAQFGVDIPLLPAFTGATSQSSTGFVDTCADWVVACLIKAYHETKAMLKHLNIKRLIWSCKTKPKEVNAAGLAT